MAVPGRAEAARILLVLDPEEWLLRHSAAVAEVAAFLAERISARGTALDTRLVEAAALLHDVGKALPAAESPDGADHAALGAAWLSRRGHPELAPAVMGHTARLLSDEQRYPVWVATASLEERLVAYADKRASQELISLDARFAAWRARQPDLAGELDLGLQRARELEFEVCQLAGVPPEEVGRSAWAADLLRFGALQPR